MQLDTQVGFLGGGNMARSLLGGLISRGHQAGAIRVHDIDNTKLEALNAEFGVCPAADIGELRDCAVIVLAIKPQQMRTALGELRDAAGEHRPLLVSIAAGIRVDSIARWAGAGFPLVRCMPNTPALIGAGATAMYAGPEINRESRMLAEAILGSAGITVWVEQEPLLDAVTALSGSGPAYYFRIQELMVESAVKLGLDRTLAGQLAAQTALGAARMVQESGTPAATLRQQVTSPGGTTERALQVFGQGGLDRLIDDALQAACQRSRELAEQLDKDDNA